MKLIALILAMTLTTAHAAEPLTKPGALWNFGNEFSLSHAQDWQKGCFDGGLIVTLDAADGAVTLADGAAHGRYFSPIFKMNDPIGFREVYISWNADTPPGTGIRFHLRIFCQNSKIWNPWTPLADWSLHHRRTVYRNTENSAWSFIAAVPNHDKPGASSRRFQIMAELYSDNDQKPVLWHLHAATRNFYDSNAKDQWGRSVYPKEYRYAKEFADETEINAFIHKNPNNTIRVSSFDLIPKNSQCLRDPRIALHICNPLSAGMLINGALIASGHSEKARLPEEFARAAFAHGPDIFGHWAFGAALAAAFGFRSYVTWTTPEGLKRYILDDIPVVVSAAYSSEPLLPRYLPNATGDTPGHILCIVGWRIDDSGNEWLICLDPYAPDDAAVLREYPLPYFLNAWDNSLQMAYPIIPRPVPGVGNFYPRRETAHLVCVGNGEFELWHDGAPLDIVDDDFNLIPYVFWTTDDREFHYLPANNGKPTLTLPPAAVAREDFRLYAVADCATYIVGCVVGLK